MEIVKHSQINELWKLVTTKKKVNTNIQGLN